MSIEINKKEKLQQLEQVANLSTYPSKRFNSFCYDDDDDDDYNFAITPNEPDNSLKFTTFSNILFDAEYKFDYSDDQSFYDEDVPEKIFSNPLFEEEITPMKIDHHHYNAESDLIESLHTHDSSIIISSKIDSRLDEFAGELTLLKSIPSGIDETDCDPEEEIRLIEILLYDNSSPRPPKEFVSENSDAKIESFSPSPILIEDSDSLMEEINLSLLRITQCHRALRKMTMTLKGIFSFLRTCLAMIPFHFLKKSHSILLFPHSLVLLQNHQMEKSSDLLYHQRLKAFQPSAKCPMMIHGKNTPILDYVRDNEVPVVHRGASSVPTDAFMMIHDDMCEPQDQSVSYPSRN
nr:hypothetical protein [Tanacetum cinerariifolium]